MPCSRNIQQVNINFGQNTVAYHIYCLRLVMLGSYLREAAGGSGRAWVRLCFYLA